MTTVSVPLQSQKIITRSEAATLGLTRYFSGKLCVNGHISQRNMTRKCLECISVKNKKYRTANPDKIKHNNLQFRAENPKYSVEWFHKNPGRAAALYARWSAQNQGLVRASRHKYRVRAEASGGKLTKGLAERLFKLQRGKCACCGQSIKDGYHLDHIIPLALGGPNVDSNIQLLKPRCNQQKHMKHPIEFMQERGFLL